ncbi:phage portal protein [Nocardia sp. NPDC005746]|uniref:phage portal protein n=1 Tax=Nocardia sp. NPDC005746 TaxID=3157062 RepID=UPI0033D9D995
MVELRTQLTDDERDMLGKLNAKHHKDARHDKLLDAYFEGSQRLKHIGLAVPEELRIFELVANWPGMYVRELKRRSKIKAIFRPGRNMRDPEMQEAFTTNNLAAQVSLLIEEARIFGRAFAVVGTNDEDTARPLVSVESARQISVLVDRRRRRLAAGFRQFREDNGERVGTLLLPDKTIQVVAGRGGWVVDSVGSDDGRDEHKLGRVPMVMFLNRQRLGQWHGASEMSDVMGITDACARTLTNMGVGVETHAVPPRWALGMSKGDFVDKDGKPLPVWQSYYQSIWATQKSPKDAALGQFSATDLRNFHETVKLYAGLASSVTGLPFRYFGENTANPAAEGAIRADESRIVSNVEDFNTQMGVGLSWVMALYERFRTGEWPAAGDPISVQWRDPATPTRAEEADAIQKLNGGNPVLSREGSWDEMGWDEERKARERGYFEDEGIDPEVTRIQRELDAKRAADTLANSGVDAGLGN